MYCFAPEDINLRSEMANKLEYRGFQLLINTVQGVHKSSEPFPLVNCAHNESTCIQDTF